MRALIVAAIFGAASVSGAATPTWRLDLATMPEYVAGFPLPIVLTLGNVTPSTSVNDVPGWSLWSIGKAQLTFVLVDAAGKRHEIALPKARGDVYGESYGPGQARRMLFDLSLLGALPPPGSYTLRVVFREPYGPVTSNEARFELHAPTREDATAAAKLSRGAPWPDFVSANWRTVTEHASPKAERQLALHRFVQRVVYGPESLAAYPLSSLAPLEHGLYAPEGELCRVVLLVARRDMQSANAAVSALTARVPGLKEAADQALLGRGELLFLRQSVGAERADPPGAIPYRH